MIHNKFRTGLDVLEAEKFSSLRGKKVALLVNQASVDQSYKHIIELARNNGVNVTKIFSPEHGLFGEKQDMETCEAEKQFGGNVPIISLYGSNKESLKLCPKDLFDVDVLVCDLQDIGSRYYTFHCTIAWAMEAIAQTQKKLMILDRPNPINAESIEGNMIKPEQYSFVGAYPILNRHGFTMGELIMYLKDYYGLSFDLEIVKMENYQRSAFLDEYVLSFVPPSPNMAKVDTAIVYPGACLLEGTNLSEGRGTTTPFELMGAPYIKEPEKLKERIDSYGFEGVYTRAVRFRPMFQKWAKEICQGLFVHVTNRNKFRPLRFYIALISEVMKIQGFKWRTEIYEFEENRLAIDLLLGDPKIKENIETGNLNAVFAHFDKEEKQFNQIRKKFLLY